MSGSNYTPMQLDDNLANGQTYTFQFQCQNWFCLTDLSQTILADIVAQGPSFLTSPSVTSPPTTALYNVQFTYEGDGSDVVSDVANSIIAACKAVSGDALSFIGAVGAAAADITVSPTQAAAQVAQTATNAAKTGIADIGQVGTQLAQSAGDIVNKATQQALSAILPVLIVVVLIVLFVLPSLSKSTRESGLV